LNKQNQKKSESEDNIRKALSRMKELLKQFSIPQEKIIVHVHSFGYRINTQNIAIKMQMSH
jgi:hypothetical protein